MSEKYCIVEDTYESDQDGVLSIYKGEKIQILNDDDEWWYGVVVGRGEEGYFPSNFVRLIDEGSPATQDAYPDPVEDEPQAPGMAGNPRASMGFGGGLFGPEGIGNVRNSLRKTKKTVKRRDPPPKEEPQNNELFSILNRRKKKVKIIGEEEKNAESGGAKEGGESTPAGDRSGPGTRGAARGKFGGGTSSPKRPAGVSAARSRFGGAASQERPAGGVAREKTTSVSAARSRFGGAASRERPAGGVGAARSRFGGGGAVSPEKPAGGVAHEKTTSVSAARSRFGGGATSPKKPAGGVAREKTTSVSAARSRFGGVASRERPTGEVAHEKTTSVSAARSRFGGAASRERPAGGVSAARSRFGGGGATSPEKPAGGVAHEKTTSVSAARSRFGGVAKSAARGSVPLADRPRDAHSGARSPGGGASRSPRRSVGIPKTGAGPEPQLRRRGGPTASAGKRHTVAPGLSNLGKRVAPRVSGSESVSKDDSKLPSHRKKVTHRLGKNLSALEKSLVPGYRPPIGKRRQQGGESRGEPQKTENVSIQSKVTVKDAEILDKVAKKVLDAEDDEGRKLYRVVSEYPEPKDETYLRLDVGDEVYLERYVDEDAGIALGNKRGTTDVGYFLMENVTEVKTKSEKAAEMLSQVERAPVLQTGRRRARMNRRRRPPRSTTERKREDEENLKMIEEKKEREKLERERKIAELERARRMPERVEEQPASASRVSGSRGHPRRVPSTPAKDDGDATKVISSVRMLKVNLGSEDIIIRVNREYGTLSAIQNIPPGTANILFLQGEEGEVPESKPGDSTLVISLSPNNVVGGAYYEGSRKPVQIVLE